MQETWKSIIHHQVKPNTMLVSSEGHFMNQLTNEICDEYHSTNGYNYILLELNDTEYERSGKQYRLFPSDDIIAETFILVPEHLKECEFIQVSHKNGDTRDNRVDNLEWVSDEYRWANIDIDDVRSMYYQVSDRGEIRRIYDNYIITPILDKDGYQRISLIESNYHKLTVIVHRLVALYFVKGYTDERYIVNHINGIRTNNYWKNLEWVTAKENSVHASITLSLPRGDDNAKSLITDANARIICESLNKYNGSIIRVFNELKDSIQNLSYPIISSIKYNTTFNHVSKNILTEDGLKKQDRHDDYETVIDVAKVLKKNNGNVKKTRDDLIAKYPWISLGYIWHLKDKSVNADITDEIFSKDEFPKCLTMTNEIADDVAQALLRHKGEQFISQIVYEELKDKYPGLTKDHVRYIKDKRTFTKISDKYFQKGELG